MRVYTASNIKAWDAFTMRHQQISSLTLMESAARAVTTWLAERYPTDHPFYIFCGNGNNGGDGLAIARLLQESGYVVHCFYISGTNPSADFNANMERLQYYTRPVNMNDQGFHFPDIPAQAIIIDALFGIGMNRTITGTAATVIEAINTQKCTVIAIDMPSGLMCDAWHLPDIAVKATYTLTFEACKPAFLFPESFEYTGEIEILSIGLDPAFVPPYPSSYEGMDAWFIHTLLRPRGSFAHKGTAGHAALWAGQKGMMGAAVLSARACMRSGAGKLSCCTPEAGLNILQSQVPEAMVQICGDTHLIYRPLNLRLQAIGVGPGIGISDDTHELLLQLLQQKKPLVIDADAINILSTIKPLPVFQPPVILTPHVTEAERLVGKQPDSEALLKSCIEFCKQQQCCMILKGKWSRIITPSGKVYINPTGNEGMATAGTGDVLCGLTTGLLAQGYDITSAACIATYWHGMAGDIAKEELGAASMIAGDVINHLGSAWLRMLSSS